jgi:hypothetical protein
LISKYRQNKKLFAPLILIGGYFLAVSLSRSAYFALVVGVVYLFNKNDWYERYKAKFWIVVGFVVLFFIGSGFLKQTLLSRQYFVQAVLGAIDNPLGVGMGNFGTVSQDTSYHIFNLNSYSSLVHNLFLEVFVGLGVFGALFAYWVFKDMWEMVKKKDKKTLVYEAGAITLVANFFFDTTYIIPTMLWLFFILLGLSKKGEIKK